MSIGQHARQRRADLRDLPVCVNDRQSEPRPQIRTALADALEKAEVLGEAAERDVLPVVRRRLGIALARRECLHRAAERRPRLVEDDVRARVHELERRGEPCQATADDRHPHVPGRLSLPPSGAGLRERLTTLAARSWLSCQRPPQERERVQRKTPRATTASFSGVESRVLPWKTS